jgi:hypothetical protein
MSLPLMAQTAPEVMPKDYVAAGMSWNQYSAPEINGNLLYAHKITDQNTYSFTFMDVISKSWKPFTATTAVSTGVAQHVRTIGPARCFLVTTVGVAAGGDNVGYVWTGGGAFAIPIGKSFTMLPNVRVLKSSLSDFQYIAGIMIGFGSGK